MVYTIFSGDQVEKVDLEVIGLMHNALGPKEDIILVKLLGDKAAQTGVAAGMSGSPVYFDGKLAGALSLKLGAFTKDAIGGVTPIADMLDVEKYSASDAPGTLPQAGAKTRCERHGRRARRVWSCGAQQPRREWMYLRIFCAGLPQADPDRGNFLFPLRLR